jgi:probable rRNA maturation factor
MTDVDEQEEDPGATSLPRRASASSAGPGQDPAWYQNRQRKIAVDDGEVAAFVRRAGRELGQGREFAVVVASDDAVRRANGRFRGQRYSTDVLSFPDGEDGRMGDILISAQRAARQAEQFGHRVEDELKVLVLHGLLHLLGFDHETDAGAMLRAETRWRKKYGLEPALTERAAK